MINLKCDTQHPCRNTYNHLRSRQVGQTTMEFALTFVMVLTLIFGIIDLSRLAYAATVVQAAATEGARRGVIDVDEVIPAVHNKMIGLDEDRTQIDISMPNDDSVLVAVTYKFQFHMPLIAQIITSEGFDLYGSAQMLIR